MCFISQRTVSYHLLVFLHRFFDTLWICLNLTILVTVRQLFLSYFPLFCVSI